MYDVAAAIMWITNAWFRRISEAMRQNFTVISCRWWFSFVTAISREDSLLLMAATCSLRSAAASSTASRTAFSRSRICIIGEGSRGVLVITRWGVATEGWSVAEEDWRVAEEDWGVAEEDWGVAEEGRRSGSSDCFFLFSSRSTCQASSCWSCSNRNCWYSSFSVPTFSMNRWRGISSSDSLSDSSTDLFAGLA